MEYKRLLQIFNSKGVIDVAFEDNSVWIESVNDKDMTANVKDLKTDEIKKVSVLDLAER